MVSTFSLPLLNMDGLVHANNQNKIHKTPPTNKITIRMQELKEALTELNLTYKKVTDLIGAGHPVSKKVLSILKTHNPDNAHQIVMEKMGQKKEKSQKDRVSVAGKVKSFFKNI